MGVGEGSLSAPPRVPLTAPCSSEPLLLRRPDLRVPGRRLLSEAVDKKAGVLDAPWDDVLDAPKGSVVCWLEPPAVALEPGRGRG